MYNNTKQSLLWAEQIFCVLKLPEDVNSICINSALKNSKCQKIYYMRVTVFHCEMQTKTTQEYIKYSYFRASAKALVWLGHSTIKRTTKRTPKKQVHHIRMSRHRSSDWREWLRNEGGGIIIFDDDWKTPTKTNSYISWTRVTV